MREPRVSAVKQIRRLQRRRIKSVIRTMNYQQLCDLACLLGRAERLWERK